MHMDFQHIKPQSSIPRIIIVKSAAKDFSRANLCTSLNFPDFKPSPAAFIYVDNSICSTHDCTDKPLMTEQASTQTSQFK